MAGRLTAVLAAQAPPRGLAHLHAKERLKVGDTFVHESYIGSRFTGRIEEETRVGNFTAIVPSIEGFAIATGFNQIWIDDEDPFAKGFQVSREVGP